MDKIFGPASAKKALGIKEFEGLTNDVFKIPKIFCEMLHTRMEKVCKTGLVKQGANTLISREAIEAYWMARDYHRKDPKRRLFDLLKQENSKTLVGDDFKPMFKYLLDSHPGLEFL